MRMNAPPFYHCTHPFLHLLRHRSRYSMVTSAFSFGRANGVQETCTHSVRVTWWSTPTSPVVSSCGPLLGQIGMKSSRRSLTGSSGRDHSWFTHACSCLVLQSTHRLMNCELSVVFSHARFPQGPFFLPGFSEVPLQPYLINHDLYAMCIYLMKLTIIEATRSFCSSNDRTSAPLDSS